MAKVIWTVQAWDELAEINYNLSEHSQRYADHIVDRIIGVVNHLETFPQLGRVVPELNVSLIREVIVEKYRVVYFNSASGEIQILTVRHSSRPLPDSILPN